MDYRYRFSTETFFVPITARGITSKRVTSGEIHLRGLTPGQHSSEETSQRWRQCIRFDRPWNRTPDIPCLSLIKRFMVSTQNQLVLHCLEASTSSQDSSSQVRTVRSSARARIKNTGTSPPIFLRGNFSCFCFIYLFFLKPCNLVKHRTRESSSAAQHVFDTGVLFPVGSY